MERPIMIEIMAVISAIVVIPLLAIWIYEVVRIIIYGLHYDD